ncbi:hypothetical protein L7F22_028397 [Adiantum nelumboides]|nr:hypothetical protein [Adiantum nelumboides]
MPTSGGKGNKNPEDTGQSGTRRDCKSQDSAGAALLQNQEPAVEVPSTSDSATLNTLAALQEELHTEKLQRQLLVSGFMSQTELHKAKVKQLEEELARAKADLEAVGSLASTSQIHQAETHVPIQPPQVPKMPEFQGTEEEEQQRPAPGALDIREEMEQEIEDLLGGPAKEYIMYEKKVMESAALAFLQPEEQVKDFRTDFLPLSLMRHEEILWKEKMRPAMPRNEDGGYEGIPLTSEHAKTLIEDHPRWRKTWLSERPRNLTNFHNTPQSLQIDPTYCPVPRQRSWVEFQKWKGKNKALLNYPILSAQEPPTVNYVVNTLNTTIQLLREVPDIACQMLVKIAKMIVTCIQVFRDTEDDDHPWNLFLEGKRGIYWNLRDSPPRWIIMALYSRLMYLPSHFLQTFKEAFVTEFFKLSTQIFHPWQRTSRQGRQINNQNQGQADLNSNISTEASVNQKLNLPLETIVQDSLSNSSSELSYFEMASSSTKVNFDQRPSNKGEFSDRTPEHQLLFLKFQFVNELGAKIYKYGMERCCVKIEDRRGDMRDLVPVIYSGDRYFDEQEFMYIVVLNPSIVNKWGMTGTKEKVDVEPEAAPPALDKPNLKLRRINDMSRVNTDNIFLGLYKYDGGEHATYYRCKEPLLKELTDEKKLYVFTYGEDVKTELIMTDKYGRSYVNVGPKELARYTYFGGPLPNYYFTPPRPELVVRQTESMGYPVCPNTKPVFFETRPMESMGYSVCPNTKPVFFETRPMESMGRTAHLGSGTYSRDAHARESMSHRERDTDTRSSMRAPVESHSRGMDRRGLNRFTVLVHCEIID